MSNGENMAFNLGDFLFQVFSLLFIAVIVTMIVTSFRMIRRRRMELKKVEERLNKVIEKNDLKE
ncbi:MULTISPECIES: hypothetical protein [Bacillus]|uniref:DUF4083 domain-containing protein n=1 Tax=Bacillus pumilus TaxID=1408 RepID=A0AAE3WIH1_BACPU|nr:MULTISPECIES: hypothetical protein [Bacillus]AZV52466.1 hypothetical protein DKE43_04800 [Bacillus pumilus]MBU5260109.1 hypothetical protein [Bacillus pumilus]MCK6162476.1 hypothetical protein [Bacillus pumilus]MCK6182982.1 hypothetical protein [Bacillus pumilus]MCW6697736.1 hypothetical protein [Bacillus sp. RP12]